MKKTKIVVFILILTLSVLMLASCFTSEEKYIEWELSGNTLTGGDTSYTLFGKTDYWQESDNYAFYYVNTVTLDNGRYAHLSRPIGREDIILAEVYYVHEYGESYEETRIYCLDTAKGALEAIWNGVDMSYVSLTDRSNLKASLADAELKALIGTLSGRETVKLSYNKLRDLQRLELVSYSLEGFLAHNHGAFFFDYGSVYYLNLEGMPEYILRDGNLSSKPINYELVKLTADEIAILDRAREGLVGYDEKLEWETPVYIEDDGTDARHAGALAVLLVIVGAFGILLPLVPMIYTLAVSVKRKWAIPVYDYVTLGASILWFISGVVVFIVLLC